MILMIILILIIIFAGNQFLCKILVFGLAQDSAHVDGLFRGSLALDLSDLICEHSFIVVLLLFFLLGLALFLVLGLLLWHH